MYFIIMHVCAFALLCDGQTHSFQLVVIVVLALNLVTSAYVSSAGETDRFHIDFSLVLTMTFSSICMILMRHT